MSLPCSHAMHSAAPPQPPPPINSSSSSTCSATSPPSPSTSSSSPSSSSSNSSFTSCSGSGSTSPVHSEVPGQILLRSGSSSVAFISREEEEEHEQEEPTESATVDGITDCMVPLIQGHHHNHHQVNNYPKHQVHQHHPNLCSHHNHHNPYHHQHRRTPSSCSPLSPPSSEPGATCLQDQVRGGGGRTPLIGGSGGGDGDGGRNELEVSVPLLQDHSQWDTSLPSSQNQNITCLHPEHHLKNEASLLTHRHHHPRNPLPSPPPSVASTPSPLCPIMDVVVASTPSPTTMSSASTSSPGSNRELDPDPDHPEHLGQDYECGIFSFRPKFLQKWATKQSFLIIFCLTSVLQGMYFTYFVSVLTTIEKLYQIPSKTTGIIMSATEIGQIGGALFLTYFGGQGHRPKWIASGMLVFALASVLCSTPHYLVGDISVAERAAMSRASKGMVPPSLNESNIFPASTTITTTTTTISTPFSPSLCHVHPDHQAFLNSSCEDEELQTTQSRVTTTVLSVFFVSLFLVGIGSTAAQTLGIPYIDDNVAPKESPLYFCITIGVRIFGPVFGFLLGSICTSIYVDFPFGNDSSLTPSDPQWIGAWWLGVLIVGFSLSLASIPMMSFPQKLPSPDPSSYCHKLQQDSIRERQMLVNQKEVLPSPDTTEDQLKDLDPIVPSSNQNTSVSAVKPTIRGFPAAVKRLLNNDILLYRTASSVLHILPIAGLYTFLPKYLESQFQLTASKANMISGMAGILVMGFGIFASGIFMRKFKPSARFVAAWIAVSALLYAGGMVLLMCLGCPLTPVAGINHPVNITCQAGCSCSDGSYSPICTSEGITYPSPCLAGCTEFIYDNNTYKYTNCECLPEGVTAINGNCPLECDNLFWYIMVFSIFVLVHSTCEVGAMLLTLRCVEPQDKAMALGLVSFAIGLFGNVPCPILYGAVVDSTCLFWENTCGKPGACRIYDSDKFRMSFHGITAIIMFIAFFVDSVVWIKASTIKFNDDEEEVQDQVPPENKHHITRDLDDDNPSSLKGEISLNRENSVANKKESEV